MTKQTTEIDPARPWSGKHLADGFLCAGGSSQRLQVIPYGDVDGSVEIRINDDDCSSVIVDGDELPELIRQLQAAGQ